MARAILKLKRPITQFELDLDENSLEAVGFIRMSEVKINADRIRTMSIEEIENWFWWMHKEMMRYTDSRVFVHDWLRQEGE